ncbi:MAG: UDP-N-acetylmuramate--L-alanine ligase [Bacteroidales bacterium]|nr:UDP-N-acetylmuramate--L-alanine ligase [Bacteroidales bacterium]MCF8337967.1 UDP-N-acetylmuramate--L-alanine ligase [Bacteroidales bacterium]
MKDPEHIEAVYFLGIGGIGMSALARYFHSRGMQVAGYDKTSSRVTQQLASEGISIHHEDDPGLIPEKPDLVVYTPAVPKTLQEYQHLEARNIPIRKRSQVLGMITSGHYTIAVAGTHGKTSVSALIAHILHQAGQNVTAFVGGIMKNYQSNCLIAEETDIVVVEADEFDRSFLQLNPDLIVITAIDADHLDIYGNAEELENSFREFAGHLKNNGKLVVEKSLEVTFSEFQQLFTYGNDSRAGFRPYNAYISEGYQFFDLATENKHLSKIRFSLPGSYNRQNAAAAFAAAMTVNVEPKTIRQALESFEGVERRFDIRLRTEKITYIDDYAHHPSELSACIEAVRTLFPGKKVTGIFQPHLYSRTRDFADGFAQSLDQLDEAILIPIYPAREEPIEGVSSEMIYNKMQAEQKYLYQKNEIIDKLKAFDLEVILTLGAGDIDRLVKQLQSMLEARYT